MFDFSASSTHCSSRHPIPPPRGKSRASARSHSPQSKPPTDPSAFQPAQPRPAPCILSGACSNPLQHAARHHPRGNSTREDTPRPGNFLLLFREQNRGVLDRIMTGDHHFADIPEQPPTDKLPPDADGRLPALPPGSAPPSAPTEASTRQPGRPIDKMLHKPDRAH